MTSCERSIDKKQWADFPFSVRWRAHLIRIPRCFPRPLLHLTCPKGPYPFVVQVPSRYVNHVVPVWVFIPPKDKIPGGHRSVPIHLDFHGGDFVMGGPFEQAPFCAQLARDRGCIVLGVDYSLGPLYQFPAALEDAEDIVKAVFDGDGASESGRALHTAISARGIRADPSQLSLSGFSSGGNLVVNLVLNVTDEKGDCYPSPVPMRIPRPIPVLLFYPQLEQIYDSHSRPAPDRRVSRPGRFGRSIEELLVPTYIPHHLRRSRRASPALVDPKHLHPQTCFFIVIPERDTLKGPIESWISRLRSADFENRLMVYRAPGMSHGWANFPARLLGTTATRLKNDALKEMQQFLDRVTDCEDVEEDVRGEVSSQGFTGVGVAE